MDADFVESQSGLAWSVNSPTKDTVNNPIFPSGVNTHTWDAEKSYASVVYKDATWHLFYYGLPAAGSPNFICYATSADGLTWAKPNLGNVSYGGNTNNNIIMVGIVSSVWYDAVLAKWIMTAEDNGSGTGLYVLTADDPEGPYTLQKQITPGGTVEGREVVRLPEGRWAAYYSTGHQVQLRSQAASISATSSLSGTWSTVGSKITATSSDHQYYAIAINQLGDVYAATVMVYDLSAETIRIDLYAGRDGFAWTLVKENWIPLGAGGAWDDSMILHGARITEVGDDWWIYYTGSPQGHNVFPPNSARIGRAQLERGRLGQVAGTGHITTTPVQPTGGRVLTVNADASGGTLDIELQDLAGTPLTGFAAADFDTITTDDLDHSPTWGGLPMPTGQAFRIKFVLDDATLYSYEIA